MVLQYRWWWSMYAECGIAVCISRLCSQRSCVRSFSQDTFHLETPGGGGYGNPNGMLESSSQVPRPSQYAPKGSLHTYKLTQESS